MIVFAAFIPKVTRLPRSGHSDVSQKLRMHVRFHERCVHRIDNKEAAWFASIITHKRRRRRIPLWSSKMPLFINGTFHWLSTTAAALSGLPQVRRRERSGAKSLITRHCLFCNQLCVCVCARSGVAIRVGVILLNFSVFYSLDFPLSLDARWWKTAMLI